MEEQKIQRSTGKEAHQQKHMQTHTHTLTCINTPTACTKTYTHAHAMHTSKDIRTQPHPWVTAQSVACNMIHIPKTPERTGDNRYHPFKKFTMKGWSAVVIIQRGHNTKPESRLG